MTKQKFPLIIGHRGALALAPENTPASFEIAIQSKADGVELDVHLTADQKLVVYHDALLGGSTNGQGPIAHHTLDDLRKLRLKKAPESGLYTFDEILDVIVNHNLEIQLEFKADHLGNAYTGIEHKVAAALRARKIQENFILTSFSPDIIGRVHKAMPEYDVLASVNITSAAALSGFNNMVKTFDQYKGCILAIQKSLLRYHLDACVISPGLSRIGVWVINSPNDLTFWLKSGVRHIVTDNPKLAVEIRNKIAKGKL